MPHLAVVLTGGVPVASDGRGNFSAKSLSGMEEFVAQWPGDVTFVATPVQQDIGGNLGTDWLELEQLPFALELGPVKDTVERIRPDVTHIPLKPTYEALLAGPGAKVVVAENPVQESLRLAIADGLRRSVIPRALVGAARQARVLNRMIDAADGLACNGWAAWDTWHRRSLAGGGVPPLRFFDTRLSAARVAATAAARGQWSAPEGSPIRLGFSGRFIRSKGADHALRASEQLSTAGIDHTLTFFGAGPLEDELRAGSGPQVTFAGSLPFEPEWVERVPREIDLMLLPHVQGDPAGTYLESAGLGVPVLGFNNRGLAGHVRHIGLGWTVPMRSTKGLVAKVTELAADREQLAWAGRRGAEFMLTHSFEDECGRRVAHLLDVLKATECGKL